MYMDSNQSMDQIKYDDSCFPHEDVLNALYGLSEVFGQCKVKSLLLPRMGGENEHCDDYMTSFETLHKTPV